MEDLQELLTYESSLVHINNFVDEFETIKKIHTCEKEKRILIQSLNLTWLRQVDDQSLKKNETNKSKDLREKGNDVYNAKDGSRDILKACRLYTKAIFAAGSDYANLCLAYANRAIALQSFGYYKQAYDDCETALEFGYPKRLQHKLQSRQAFCALQLKDPKNLKKHINALEKLHLNEVFKTQLDELQRAYQRLKVDSGNLDNTPVDCNKTKIIHNPVFSGQRYMVALESIKENEIIFIEEASSFVPVGNCLICQQCAATQLIPIPCEHCNGQVVYCSRKCRESHKATHAYECAAYRCQLFQHVGIAHLAFHMTVEELPRMLSDLKFKQNAFQIWQTIGKPNGSLYQSKTYGYAQSLRMISHLGKMKTKDIIWFALIAELLQFYLHQHTQFFNIFADTTATVQDWNLITAALILRHIGQLICNAHVSISLISSKHVYGKDSQNFSLLLPEIWCRPYGVHRGKLHKLCHYTEIAAMNCPYLSLCNHSCEPSFQTRFSGRYVTTYATKKLEINDEITNCYTLDFRKSKHQTRCLELQQIYHFSCTCVKCIREFPDADYELFHCYRCEQSNCRATFVPKFPNSKTLDWWLTAEDERMFEPINCPICGSRQNFKWFYEFKSLICSRNTIAIRSKLYELFDTLNNWLLNYHELRMSLGHELVVHCFATQEGEQSLRDHDYTKLVDILKYIMSGTSKKCRTNSIEFVSTMTYLWDIIAFGKYNCSTCEMQEMLNSIEIISEEYKIVFMNYFEDYLEKQIT